eukprot:5654591-Prymnesium_polylepis.1
MLRARPRRAQEVIGWTVVDIQTDDKDDLTETVIREKLKKASGANYDLGSNAGGTYQSKAGDIGKSAAAKYKELEKSTNIGPVRPPAAGARARDGCLRACARLLCTPRSARVVRIRTAPPPPQPIHRSPPRR